MFGFRHRGEADRGDVGARLDPGWRARAPRAWLDEGARRRVEVAGGWLEVEERGAGRPTLLLPPLPGWKEAWIAVAPRLAPARRTLAPDLRTRFAGRPSWEALLDDLDRIADALADGPLDVVGHSLGGALALRWAITRPGRVRRLVVSSAFARVRTPRRQWFSRFVEQPVVLAAQRWLPERAAIAGARRLAARRRWVYDPGCGEEVLALVRHGIRTVPPAQALACLDLAFALDVRDRLGEVHAPTLVVVGAAETPFALEAARELAAGIPRARLERSPGAAHLHPLSAPEWLAGRIAWWLDAPEPALRSAGEGPDA